MILKIKSAIDIFWVVVVVEMRSIVESKIENKCAANIAVDVELKHKNIIRIRNHRNNLILFRFVSLSIYDFRYGLFSPFAVWICERRALESRFYLHTYAIFTVCFTLLLRIEIWHIIIAMGDRASFVIAARVSTLFCCCCRIKFTQT